MPTLPIVIHKHWIGYVFITAVGVLLGGLLALALVGAYMQGIITPLLYTVVGAFIVLVMVGVMVQLSVYGLTTITLTDTGITVINWYSLLFSQQSETAWTKIQDVSSSQDGALPQVLDYGTLLIQTAGTDKNCSITYVPRPDYWTSFIQSKAAATPQPTHAV